MRSSTALLITLISTAGAARADKLERDDLAGPPLEVASDPTKIAPPAVPSFELPALEAGVHGPRELRVHGRGVLGSEIKVKGYVTGIYDCASALAAANPKATRAQITASITKNPALCEPAKFYLGDRKDTARDASLWVADVPALGKGKLPKLAVGDFVIVTGTWDTQSAHNEHSADGLLKLGSVERAKPGPEPAAPTANDSPPGPAPDIEVVTQAPPRPSFDAAARTESINHLNACNKAFASRQYDAAITECRAATQIWPGNHLAWYVGGSAHMAKNEWPEAKASTEAAVTKRPDQAMYQLYYGIALYEAERARAHDPALFKLDPAREALLRAAKLGPALWRAHFYLGRVYNDLDDARHAAEQFAFTIATHPAYRFGYLALADLEQRWGFYDDSIEIATLGLKNVPADEAGELRFARGQGAFKKGDFTNAKRDLDDVMASPDPNLAAMRPLAAQMLAQIARHH